MKFFREDIVASVIVFIVALPLSLGVALASGGSPEAGLITAIIGGIVCGFLSGAPLVVAGPAAGLSAFVFQLLQQNGLAALAAITLIAGLFQLSMGLFKLGRLFTYVPKSILEGMLSVIGFIIATYQVHVLLGQTTPSTTLKAIVTLPTAFSNVYWPILLCGTLAVAIQLLWAKGPKSMTWIPGALPAVIIATLVSLFWEMPRVEIANSIEAFVASAKIINLEVISANLNGIIPAALGLALVASAETLLTAIAVDGLAANRFKNHKPANLNRELIAHGVSNSVSGLVGGLPMTGVIVRSAVNVNSGARTRVSTMLHGVWILLFVILLPAVLKSIPLTGLAAVLVVTGFKLLNFNEFLHVWKSSRWDGILWALTFMSILLTDLLTGLIISISVYALGEMTLKLVAAWRLRNTIKVQLAAVKINNLKEEKVYAQEDMGDVPLPSAPVIEIRGKEDAKTQELL